MPSAAVKSPELSGHNPIYQRLCGAGLKPSAWVLYLWLENYQNKQNKCVETTMTTICKGNDRVRPCGLSMNTIYASLQDLETAGLVQVETEGETRQSVTRIYLL